MSQEEKTFQSDFYLKPSNINFKSGLATWHEDTDPAIHDLIDGFRTEPVSYSRKRKFDGKYQDCKVVREDTIGDGSSFDIILLPGDGSRYYVSRISKKIKLKMKKLKITQKRVLFA